MDTTRRPPSRRPLAAALGVVLTAALLAGACGTEAGTGTAASGDVAPPTAPSSATVTPAPLDAPCPVAPIAVVVSVDQWGDIVSRLGGNCVALTTVISGSSVDPHDYEPTAADAAAFSGARLVVVNGVDYDHWAADAADATSPRPVVVDAGAVVGRTDGDNPHLWYSPADVQQVADAITAELVTLAPVATEVLQERRAAFQTELQPYLDRIAAIRAAAPGAPYGATESVFDPMAAALGLTNVTPEGYQRSSANESDPSPGDVDRFQRALRDGTMRVLIVNTQTAGAVPDQLRQVAEAAGVPVVEVTETVPPGTTSFVAWQLAQLDALARALGVS